MKTIKLTKPERQKLITDKLKEYPALRVSELSQDIGVSTELFAVIWTNLNH